MVERKPLAGSAVAGWLGVQYVLEPNGQITGTVTLHQQHEGPPKSGHGGLLVTLLDEAMGCAAWCAGYAVVTASLSVDFRARAPLHTPLLITAHVTHVDGRKIHTVGSIMQTDSSMVLEGQGLFIHSPHHFVDATTTLDTPHSQ